MGFKVVNCMALPGLDWGDELLKPLDATLVKGIWMTEDAIISNANDADAVIGATSGQPFSRRVLESLPNCRIVASAGVGYEMIDVDAATELVKVATNVPDYGIDEVSGLAVALILALGHKILQVDKAVREKQVNVLKNMNALMEVCYPMFRMRDQTVGIVGVGRIGMTTGLKCKGLGMRVIGYDPYIFGAVLKNRGIEPVDLETLLKESDFISLHTPLSAETQNMIGYREFKKMKRTCYFINTARGGCVDQQSLIRALQENLIAGAGIDVTVDEPISPDNPFIKMPNVILTGHSAWYSIEAQSDMFRKPMTQVILALEGKFPYYAVNPEVGKKWLKKWS